MLVPGSAEPPSLAGGVSGAEYSLQVLTDWWSCELIAKVSYVKAASK